jgi:hypothetical protein
VTGLSFQIQRVGDAWTYTAPTPLPGLHRCHTEPLESELCAIWYILTFTVFAGNLGTIITTLSAVVVDLFLLFTFIRLGRAILARMAEVINQ